jgi:hypothetical protein
MKDDEFVAQLLLLIEEGGPKSYSQDDLDAEFSSRDTVWEKADETVERYREAILVIKTIVSNDGTGELIRGRLKNQADFYSLVGAVANLHQAGEELDLRAATERLRGFMATVEDDDARARYKPADRYYAAARSASNDPGPRQTRIETVKNVIRGDV